MPAFLTYTGRSFAKGPSSPPSFLIGTISITSVIIITINSIICITVLITIIISSSWLKGGPGCPAF